MNQVTMADTTWTVAEPGYHIPNPSVAINIEGAKINISVGAFGLAGNPNYVRLLFSPSPASIAIVPTTGDDELGYTVVTCTTKPGPRGRTYSNHRTFSRPFCRMLAAAGYHGTWVVPLAWHPDGMLWGDMDGARQRENKAKGAKAA